jgi:hypothetical protein
LAKKEALAATDLKQASPMIVADSFQLMLRAVAKPFSSLLLLARRCHHLATPLDTATTYKEGGRAS